MWGEDEDLSLLVYAVAVEHSSVGSPAAAGLRGGRLAAAAQPRKVQVRRQYAKAVDVVI